MGDNRHGHAGLCKLFHDVKHLADHLGVEGGGRLVKEHDFRFHSQRAYNGDTLLLSARKHRGIGVGLIGQADTLQKLHGNLVRLRLRLELQAYRRKGDVFLHRHMREEIEVLEDHAHLPPVQVKVHFFGSNVHPVENDLARSGLLQQVQAAEEGGLAGA